MSICTYAYMHVYIYIHTHLHVYIYIYVYTSCGNMASSHWQIFRPHSTGLTRLDRALKNSLNDMGVEEKHAPCVCRLTPARGSRHKDFYMYICLCIHICLCIYICTYEHIYVHIRMCITYIYIYTFTCIYTYITHYVSICLFLSASHWHCGYSVVRGVIGLCPVASMAQAPSRSLEVPPLYRCCSLKWRVLAGKTPLSPAAHCCWQRKRATQVVRSPPRNSRTTNGRRKRSPRVICTLFKRPAAKNQRVSQRGSSSQGCGPPMQNRAVDSLLRTKSRRQALLVE